jgi:hypothetical protein
MKLFANRESLTHQIDPKKTGAKKVSLKISLRGEIIPFWIEDSGGRIIAPK